MSAPSTPSSAAAASAASGEGHFGAYEALLYAITVFAWSTSWIALKAQVGVVAPEVSLLWRFLIATALMLGWVRLRGESLRFARRDHVIFAAMGVFIFSVNFDLFYHASRGLPSGLLSVVFSLASVINLGLGRVVFRQRLERRVLIGGLLGFSGVAAMFWPRIAGADFDGSAALGLGLCVLGTIFFCAGNMLSGIAQRRGAPVLAATAWGMVYGCVVLAAAAAIGGLPLDFDPSPAYVVSLLWLSVVSSVTAFWAYLTLLGRIGAARAGYATVMFPVFALAISTIWEGYVWTIPAVVGLVAVLIGNLFVLRHRR